MQNKYCFNNNTLVYSLVIFLVLLISISFVSAEITSGIQFWKDFKYNFVESVPIWNGLNKDKAKDNMMLFYPVEDWEVEVCSRDLTSSTADHKKSATLGNFDMRFSSTTVALMASKYSYVISNDVVYNLEWYVQSIDKQVVYSVYLINSTNKFNIPGYKDVTLEPMSNSEKVFSNTYLSNYTKLLIEYHDVDSSDIKTIETEIVDDDKAAYE